MKKNIICSAAAGCVLLLVMTVAYGGWADRPQEGKQVADISRFMINEGQKMKDIQNPERARLTEQGQLMTKQGMEALNSGKMMNTVDGRKNMQRIGQMLLKNGGLLVDMGKQSGPLTQKEKEKIIKQGDSLMGFGKLMLNKGQIMGGD